MTTHVEGFTSGESDGLFEKGLGLVTKPTRADDNLVAQAWLDGQLIWLLRDYQINLYETFWTMIERMRTAGAAGAQVGDFRCGSLMGCRKIGKSHVEMLITREFQRRYAKSRVVIGAQTAKEARSVFMPALALIEETCPMELRVQRRGIDQIHYDPNGSMFVLEGANGQPDNLRGPWLDLGFIDEAAFVRRLSYVLESIMLPMGFHTRGAVILASTKNPNPASEYNAYHARCMALNQGQVIDVYHAGFTDEQIAAEKAAVLPQTWRIEFECADERDPTLTVIPEWTGDTKAACIGTVAKPNLSYHTITAADWGTVDNTPIVSGYIEPPGIGHPKGRLVLTGEAILHGAEVTARNVADSIRRLEGVITPGAVTRVGDHNNEMLNSLTFDQGLSIAKVRKPSLEGSVNALRLAIYQRRVLLHPDLVHCIACLDSGAWVEVAAANSNGDKKRQLARTELRAPDGKPMHHFDALMALVYAWVAAEPRLDALAARIGPLEAFKAAGVSLDDVAPSASMWQNKTTAHIGQGLPSPVLQTKTSKLPGWAKARRK